MLISLSHLPGGLSRWDIHPFGSEAVTEEGLFHQESCSGSLEEQAFLGLRPGCFRTLGFWRAVRLWGTLFVSPSATLSPLPGQPGGSSSCLAVLGLEEEQGFNLCQSSGACKDD